MSPRVSWLFFASRTIHQGALSPWLFAAQVANRESHLILANALQCRISVGWPYASLSHKVLRLFSSSFCPSRTFGQ